MAGICLVVALVPLEFLVADYFARRELAGLRFDADRMLDELHRDLRPPENDQNAATLYRQAVALLPPNSESSAEFFWGWETNPSINGPAKPLTEDEERAARLMTEAARTADCRFQNTPPSIRSFRPPELRYFDEMASVLVRRCETTANPEIFWEGIRALRILARRITAEPSGSSDWHGYTIVVRLVAYLQRVAERRPEMYLSAPKRMLQPPFDLRAANYVNARLMTAEVVRTAAENALVGEKVVPEVFWPELQFSFSKTGADAEWDRVTTRVMQGARLVRVAREVQTRYLRWADAPYSEIGSEITDLDQRVGGALSISGTSTETVDVNLKELWLYGSIDLNYQFAATDRLLDAIIAAYAYHVRNKGWPAEWDDLVPEFLDAVPVDPFCDQPMRLVMLPNRVRIYSIGKNLVDDGGVFPWGDFGYELRIPNTDDSPDVCQPDFER